MKPLHAIANKIGLSNGMLLIKVIKTSAGIATSAAPLSKTKEILTLGFREARP